jgi:hypothetical protein
MPTEKNSPSGDISELAKFQHLRQPSIIVTRNSFMNDLVALDTSKATTAVDRKVPPLILTFEKQTTWNWTIQNNPYSKNEQIVGELPWKTDQYLGNEVAGGQDYRKSTVYFYQVVHPQPENVRDGTVENIKIDMPDGTKVQGHWTLFLDAVEVYAGNRSDANRVDGTITTVAKNYITRPEDGRLFFGYLCGSALPNQNEDDPLGGSILMRVYSKKNMKLLGSAEFGTENGHLDSHFLSFEPYSTDDVIPGIDEFLVEIHTRWYVEDAVKLGPGNRAGAGIWMGFFVPV